MGMFALVGLSWNRSLLEIYLCFLSGGRKMQADSCGGLCLSLFPKPFTQPNGPLPLAKTFNWKTQTFSTGTPHVWALQDLLGCCMFQNHACVSTMKPPPLVLLKRSQHPLTSLSAVFFCSRPLLSQILDKRRRFCSKRPPPPPPLASTPSPRPLPFVDGFEPFSVEGSWWQRSTGRFP